MAIVVVAIHTHPIQKSFNFFNQFIYFPFIELAVPYFFLVTGFFLSNKEGKSTEENNHTLILFIKKIGLMYVIWSLIYLFINIYGFVIEDEKLEHGIVIFIKNFLFTGENYYSWPLWYLLSCIYFAIILLLFNKLKISISFFWGFVILISVVYYFNKQINELLNLNNIKIDYILKSRVFSGFIFLAIGMFLNRKLLNINNFFLLILFVGGLGMISNEKLGGILGIIFSSVSLFIFSIKFNIKFRSDFSNLLSRSSLIIFLVHMIFYFIYVHFIGLAHYPKWYAFAFTLLLSIFSSVIIDRYLIRYKLIKLIF